MENQFQELENKIQNLEAKYCDQIQVLEQELEGFRSNVKDAETTHNEERKRHKAEQSKSRKELREILKRLDRLEKYLRTTPSDQISLEKLHEESNSAAPASDSEEEYNDQDYGEDTEPSEVEHKSQKKKARSIQQDIADGDHKSAHSLAVSTKSHLTPEEDGVFEFLYDKYEKNPVDAGVVEINGNSFDVYEKRLLNSIVDSKWDGNHWLSQNVSNSYVKIDFIDFSVKIKKYRLRVGCSNGLGRFVSWDLEGFTKDDKKIVLDKVLDCAEITQEHPEVTISIENDVYVRSIRIMMRGKSSDRNYKMRFRNIELFGDIRFDK
ncbi:hypothetical protein M9Y10_035606 [Tritrichomonas musculus]|uniref:F5/8 type C domain-containing protein n=1 Tax=Tritrichomonas musculus TaxID=1915356 RepID=A0ABR2GX06_9EUKA